VTTHSVIEDFDVLKDAHTSRLPIGVLTLVNQFLLQRQNEHGQYGSIERITTFLTPDVPFCNTGDAGIIGEFCQIHRTKCQVNASGSVEPVCEIVICWRIGSKFASQSVQAGLNFVQRVGSASGNFEWKRLT